MKPHASAWRKMHQSLLVLASVTDRRSFLELVARAPSAGPVRNGVLECPPIRRRGCRGGAGRPAPPTFLQASVAERNPLERRASPTLNGSGSRLSPPTRGEGAGRRRVTGASTFAICGGGFRSIDSWQCTAPRAVGPTGVNGADPPSTTGERRRADGASLTTRRTWMDRWS